MSFGHSYVQGGWFTDAPTSPLTALTEVMVAELPWVKFFDQRFNTDVWADINAPYYDATFQPSSSVNGAAQAIGGDQLVPGSTPDKPGALARVDYMLARHPDIMYLTFGINDIILNSSVDINTLISNYDLLLTKIRAAAIWAIAEEITPVTSVWIPDGDARLQVLHDFNTWLDGQETAGRSGLKVVHSTSVLGTGDRPSQSYWLRTDGLHYQDRGAYAVAHDALLPVLQSMVSSGTYYSTDQTAGSNLMPDKTLAGTTGTKGINVTGNVATNYSASVATGASTVVASKEDIDGTYAKQVFTIRPVSDANANHNLRLTKTANASLVSLGLAAGDWVK
jgi:lysophospholipase L1-like esterase